MPMVRYQIGNEYGLSDPELYGAAEKDDPEALLEGVAMAGLVGLLRQLGDLSEFAAEIFHDLHEDVMATASRGHGLMLRLHQLEAEFPSLEKALISQINLPNVTENEGIQWHTNVHIDQNLITRGDMPRFIMDSYEECHGPPRLFTLDKFDVAGAGACLKRYSDPSFFKTELASCFIETEDTPREKKPRKIKKKASRWKKGETLESLLISSSESPPSSENQSSGKALISRVVKLKSQRNLHNSDNNSRKIFHGDLLELIESQQKIILEDSKRQSNIKAESNGINKQAAVQFSFETENEAQKMHKVYPIQEQNEASSESEKIEIGIETSSSQAREKTMTDSDVASEHENFVDALNTIELEMETDGENKSKSDSVSSFQKEMVHGNLVSDTIRELVSTNQDLEINENIEIGEVTEEFFGNDDLMDVSSTSSLHSDGVHQTGQLSISHGDNLRDELKVPDEARLDVEDVVCSTSQTDNHQEQTNLHVNNMDVPTNASSEMSEVSNVILKTQESKFLEETHILENSLDSHEGNTLLINNRSVADSDELEEPLGNPIEVSQVELRNISQEILNLEEYLISTRKDESVSQEIFSHGLVHPQETAQDFDDPNDKLQHEQSDKSEDDLNGEGSLFPNRKDEIAPVSIFFLPTEDATDLSTHMTGLDLEDALLGSGIQSSENPITTTSDDYMDNSRSTSIQEPEASSIGPQSPINVPEEMAFQGSYPRYHLDNFIEPDEVLLDLGETKEETYRNESPHHFEVETQTNQFNKSEDWQQYQNKDESRIILINHEPTDESLLAICEENACSKSHELSRNDNDSIELCAENFSCRNIVGADGMCANKSAPFSPKEECEMWAGHFEAGAKEKNPSSADFLWEPTSSPCERMFEPADTFLHYEVGEHQVSEKDLEMDACDANKDGNVCEERLSVKEDGFGHSDVGDTSVEVNELLEEDLETKSQDFFDKGKVDNELPVETSEFNEETIAESDASIRIAVKNEVLVEALESNENDGAEGGPSMSSMVNDEVIVGTSELNEENNTVVVPIPFSVIEACNISQEISAAGGIPTSSVVDNEAHVETLELNEEADVEDHVQLLFAVKQKVLIEAVKPNEIDSSEGGSPTSSAVNNEILVKSSELNEETNAEDSVPIASAVENAVLVEALKITEKGTAEGGEPTSSVVNNEILVESSELNEETNAEDSVPITSAVENEVLVEALKLTEKGTAEGGEPTSSVVNNEVPAETLGLSNEGNTEDLVPMKSMDHVHELLENKESKLENEIFGVNEMKEETAHDGASTPSMVSVHEILQEPTNLNLYVSETDPSSKYKECLHENAGHPDSDFPAEGGNISQFCTISLENRLHDASPSEKLSEESSELRSNKQVPCNNLRNVQEKLQEDINQIATGLWHNDSTIDPCTVDPNKTILSESCFPFSSFNQVQKVSEENFDSKSDNMLSGDKSVYSNEVLATALANLSVQTEASELNMCSAWSLVSEHKPPPLPPLGWRVGGKLLKGTSLPSNGHSSKLVDESKLNLSVRMRGAEAPPMANHDDTQAIEGGKPQLMSLSDLPPISFEYQPGNPNSTLFPSGENLQNMEYNNVSSAAVGFVGPQMRPPQYAWPDAQHQLLPVPAWTSGPGLVQVQPGYLISLEDNLWAQYGIGPSIEDERLGRKHCSIRNMPRNPLMDAVAAHDRSRMRKVSEMVKPDDKLKADERNSLLEQIRNKSFILRPVGAPKTTAVKAPQTNLKVAAIVEKANAIRQAFVGSDEEDGDSWSDA